VKIQQSIVVGQGPQAVWEFLWDVPRLAACIPGCKSVEPVDPPRQYRAVMEERLGPFQVRFDLDLKVLEVQEGQRISVTAEGKDARLGSPMKVDLKLELRPAGEGTELAIDSDVQVFGKLASLGHGMIRRKGEQIIGEFAKALTAQLGGQEVQA